MVSSSYLVVEPIESSWHLRHHPYVQYAQLWKGYGNTLEVGSFQWVHSNMWPAPSIQIYFGGAIEAPKPSRGVGVGIFFDFGSQNGDLWCILGAIFCSSAKTLRGRKDTLAQVYFLLEGAIAPLAPPSGIDATGFDHTGVPC